MMSSSFMFKSLEGFYDFILVLVLFLSQRVLDLYRIPFTRKHFYGISCIVSGTGSQDTMPLHLTISNLEVTGTLSEFLVALSGSILLDCGG